MYLLQVGFRVYPVGFANKSRKESRTLIDSEHMWTVCVATTDSTSRPWTVRLVAFDAGNLWNKNQQP
jgi:hypothetical protein